MLFIKRYINAENEILYKLEKRKKSIAVVLICMPLWLVICFSFLGDCFKNWFGGVVAFDSFFMYLFSTGLMLSIVPIMLMQVLNYIFNYIIITNNGVIIRKAAKASIAILEYEKVAGFAHVESDFRGFKSNRIQFYLKNGEKIETGNLFINKDSKEKLLKTLGSKVKRRYPDIIDTNYKKNKKELGMADNTNYKIWKSRNYIFLSIYYAPVVIGVLMLLLLISGFNSRFGTQTNIEVYGSVEKKEISYNYKSKSNSFKFLIRDINHTAEYEIYVEESTFNMFNEDDSILIKAKKGSLGIVYNETFYKN